MTVLSLAELLKLLDAHCGAVIVSLTARTEPKLLMRSRRDPAVVGRYPEGIEKLVRGSFMLANRYRDNVRAQRRREGHPKPESFRTGKLWAGHGERVGRFIARHVESGRLYVVARPASDEHGYPVRIWQRWIDLATGRDIAGDELVELRRDWLANPPTISHKQQLARQIPYRTYHLVSIHTLRFGGESYRLRFDRQPWLLDVH